MRDKNSANGDSGPAGKNNMDITHVNVVVYVK